MKTILASYAFALISLLVLDGIWLGYLAISFYREQMGSLLRTQFLYAPAVAFYVLYAFAVTILAVLPALKSGNIWHAVALGALLGLCAYGTYNLTNLSVLKDWPINVTVVDLIWGTSLTAAMAAVAFSAVKKLGL